MIIGGRFGDILGRRRMFLLGLVVYSVGSALTAVAPTLWVLTLGWSVIEGLVAATAAVNLLLGLLIISFKIVLKH